jgi:hypothetical protein
MAHELPPDSSVPVPDWRRRLAEIGEARVPRGGEERLGAPMEPGTAQAPTHGRVTFQAHCSRTGEPFLVLADLDGDLLRWVGGRLLRDAKGPIRDGTDGTAEVQPAPQSLRIDANGWKCPVCGSDHIGDHWYFWRCGECATFHCLGTTGAGRLLGRCGSCFIDPDALTSVERFDVQARSDEGHGAARPTLPRHDEATRLRSAGHPLLSSPAKRLP